MRLGRVWSMVLPAVWVAVSALWAGAIVVTDRPEWPLTVWIAITIGPIITLDRRSRRSLTGR